MFSDLRNNGCSSHQVRIKWNLVGKMHCEQHQATRVIVSLFCWCTRICGNHSSRVTESGLGALIRERMVVGYRKKSKSGFESFPSPLIHQQFGCKRK